MKSISRQEVRAKERREQLPKSNDIYLKLLDKIKTDSWHEAATFIEGDDGRHALIFDRTIFYPQGSGQPADTGFICIDGLDIKFVVHDVRSRDGIVFHYGVFENLGGEFELTLEKGKVVSLFVDEPRRKLNSRF